MDTAPAAAALSSKFKVEAYVYTMVREGTSPAEDYESEREIKATVWVGHRTSAAPAQSRALLFAKPVPPTPVLSR